MLPLESTLHPPPTLSLQSPWRSVGGGPGPCPSAVEILSAAVTSHPSPPDLIAKEGKASPALPPGAEPRRHSQPLLPRAGTERDLPLYHPRRAQDSSLSAHQPRDFCSQSSTRPTGVRGTSQGGPHTLRLEQMGADYLAPALVGGGGAGIDYVVQRKEGLDGGGQGRWAHLPHSVQLKTQSSLRIDTAAAVSLSFE